MSILSSCYRSISSKVKYRRLISTSSCHATILITPLRHFSNDTKKGRDDGTTKDRIQPKDSNSFSSEINCVDQDKQTTEDDKGETKTSDILEELNTAIRSLETKKLEGEYDEYRPGEEKVIASTKRRLIKSLTNHYKTKWNDEELDEVIDTTLRYWWLRTNGTLLQFYVNDGDIRNLTLKELRELFPDSSEDDSIRWAVYLRVWYEPTNDINEIWNEEIKSMEKVESNTEQICKGNIKSKKKKKKKKISKTEQFLVDSIRSRTDKMTLLVYTGLVTKKTVNQRDMVFGYQSNTLLQAIRDKKGDPTTLIVWRSEVKFSKEVVEWMEFVVVEFLQSYGRGFNRQKGGPSGSYKKMVSPDIERFFKDRLEITDKKVIHKAPEYKTVEDLEAFVRFLEESVGITSMEVSEMIQKFPKLLTCTVERHLKPIIKWLEERVGVDESERRKVVKQNPQFFSYNIDGNLEPTLNWLKETLGLDRDQVIKIIVRQASILWMNVKNLELKVKWSEETFRLNKDQVSKMILCQPSILENNIETNLAPTFEFYKEAIGEQKAISLIIKYPSIIEASLENRLKLRLKEAQDLGIDMNEGLVQRMAKLTNDGWEKSLPYQLKKQAIEDGTDKEMKIKWLEENLTLNRDEANDLVDRYPKLLNYDIGPNLEPTFDFYKKVLGDDQSAISLVTKDPSVFHAGIESRLKPRLEEAKDLGLTIDAGLVQRMAKLTDEKWKKSLAFQIKKQGRGNKE